MAHACPHCKHELSEVEKATESAVPKSVEERRTIAEERIAKATLLLDKCVKKHPHKVFSAIDAEHVIADLVEITSADQDDPRFVSAMIATAWRRAHGLDMSDRQYELAPPNPKDALAYDKMFLDAVHRESERKKSLGVDDLRKLSTEELVEIVAPICKDLMLKDKEFRKEIVLAVIHDDKQLVNEIAVFAQRSRVMPKLAGVG